jgi:UPF0176 protein
MSAEPRLLVAALYEFCRVEDPAALRLALLDRATADGLCGTLILASEGINGTIAGPPDLVRAFVADLQTGIAPGPGFAELTLKWASTDRMPFARLKIKVKREIVTLAVPEADPTQKVGRYVAPADWNRLLEDPDMVLIDTRNSFEVALGTFPGAIDPQTVNFTDFPAFVAEHLDPAQHRRVAMFCTGGIRCEKASALLLAQGFQEVYHLQGGILAYLEQIPEAERRWQGECFVFDEREVVDPQSLGLPE